MMVVMCVVLVVVVLVVVVLVVVVYGMCCGEDVCCGACGCGGGGGDAVDCGKSFASSSEPNFAAAILAAWYAFECTRFCSAFISTSMMQSYTTTHSTKLWSLHLGPT
jgi:hypothetical protein